MLDKVLKAWECCDPFNRRCFECPYEDDCFHDGFDRVAIADMVRLLKEQRETIKNLEQEIRDKNIRLNERAKQVESLLKEQKRTKGKWAERQYGFCGTCHARCSVCGKWSAGYSKETIGGNEYFFYPFCCNCGADMRGEQE